MSSSVLELIRSLGGTLSVAEATKNGVHPRDLYALRDKGDLITLTRGIYRLSEMGEASNPDLVTIASRAPRAVVCLVSALYFHNLTTKIPTSTSIAVLYGDTIPRIDYPPVKVHRFREPLYGSGVTEEAIDGIKVKVYDPEKTLADCFKFRNKLGMEVVLEALKLYWERQKPDIGKILEYAKICRVEKVMTPYLEAKLYSE